MAYWKTAAAEAVAAGYMPGHPWEQLLANHLETVLPRDWAELKASGNLRDYLITETAAAVKRLQDGIEDGEDPEAMRELVMEELLERATEDQEEVPDWMEEGANETAIAAAEKALARHGANKDK